MIFSIRFLMINDYLKRGDDVENDDNEDNDF